MYGVKMMHAHIVVYGHVQGVGFRYSVRQLAIEHGLNGWVKNNLDGTVEMEVEGEEKPLTVFIEKLKTGRFNRFCRIDDLSVKVMDNEKGFKTFHIK